MAILVWSAPHLREFFGIGIVEAPIIFMAGMGIACVYCGWRLPVSLRETFCSHD